MQLSKCWKSNEKGDLSCPYCDWPHRVYWNVDIECNIEDEINNRYHEKCEVCKKLISIVTECKIKYTCEKITH